MSIIVIILCVVVLLFIAYRTYGTYLVKKVYELDDSRKPAAHDHLAAQYRQK